MPNPVLGKLIRQWNKDFSRSRGRIRVGYRLRGLLCEAEASKLIGDSLDGGFGEGFGIEGGAAEEKTGGFRRMGDECGMEVRWEEGEG